MRRHRLAFPGLADPGNVYAKQLGIAHGLPQDLQEVYDKFGAGLPEFNGDELWELPLATRIVTDRGGVIRRIDADADYTRRPEAEASLEVLRSLS